MRETEIRTPDQHLQMCKMIITDDNQLVFQLKKGKRYEILSWETLNKMLSDFTDGKIPIIPYG